MAKFKKKVEMKKSIYFFSNVLVFIIVFFAKVSLHAQEYATDRLFMKQFNKVKCLRAVEKRVNILKTKRESGSTVPLLLAFHRFCHSIRSCR